MPKADQVARLIGDVLEENAALRKVCARMIAQLAAADSDPEGKRDLVRAAFGSGSAIDGLAASAASLTVRRLEAVAGELSIGPDRVCETGRTSE